MHNLKAFSNAYISNKKVVGSMNISTTSRMSEASTAMPAFDSFGGMEKHLCYSSDTKKSRLQMT